LSRLAPSRSLSLLSFPQFALLLAGPYRVLAAGCRRNRRDHLVAATTSSTSAIASADYTAFSMRLAALNSGFKDLVARETRERAGAEHRHSRIIKGSPGRTDARINKPAVMNEAGSPESSRIYPLLIVTEIRGQSLGADMLNQRVVAPVGTKGTAMHLGHALIEAALCAARAGDSNARRLIKEKGNATGRMSAKRSCIMQEEARDFAIAILPRIALRRVHRDDRHL